MAETQKTATKVVSKTKALVGVGFAAAGMLAAAGLMVYQAYKQSQGQYVPGAGITGQQVKVNEFLGSSTEIGYQETLETLNLAASSGLSEAISTPSDLDNGNSSVLFDIAPGENGAFHFVYFKDDKLNYGYWNDDSGKNIEVVTDDIRKFQDARGESSAARMAQIALDKDGNPVILFNQLLSDGNFQNVVNVYTRANGSWVNKARVEFEESDIGNNFWDLAIDEENSLHIACGGQTDEMHYYLVGRNALESSEQPANVGIERQLGTFKDGYYLHNENVDPNPYNIESINIIVPDDTYPIISSMAELTDPNRFNENIPDNGSFWSRIDQALEEDYYSIQKQSLRTQIGTSVMNSLRRSYPVYSGRTAENLYTLIPFLSEQDTMLSVFDLTADDWNFVLKDGYPAGAVNDDSQTRYLSMAKNSAEEWELDTVTSLTPAESIFTSANYSVRQLNFNATLGQGSEYEVDLGSGGQDLKVPISFSALNVDSQGKPRIMFIDQENSVRVWYVETVQNSGLVLDNVQIQRLREIKANQLVTIQSGQRTLGVQIANPDEPLQGALEQPTFGPDEVQEFGQLQLKK